MKKKNAILYDVYPTPTPDEDHEQLFYPRAVTQFVGMIEALIQEIPQQLLLNKSVHIRGMGTFYLKIGVRRKKDASGHWYVQKFTDPDAITARDLCIEGIGFRADPKWNRTLMKPGVPFERAKTRHQTPISISKLLKYLDKMTEEKGFVTVRDVQYDLSTTNYHARKLLEDLCKGSQPKLYREQIGRIYVYKRFGR